MLPDLGKLVADFDTSFMMLLSKLERIAVAVERIHEDVHSRTGALDNLKLNHTEFEHPEATPVFEGHVDPDSGKVSGEWQP